MLHSYILRNILAILITTKYIQASQSNKYNHSPLFNKYTINYGKERKYI